MSNRFRDNQDARGWCWVCYRLEARELHDECLCVCHGAEAKRRAEHTHPDTQIARTMKASAALRT